MILKVYQTFKSTKVKALNIFDPNIQQMSGRCSIYVTKYTVKRITNTIIRPTVNLKATFSLSMYIFT